MHPAPPVSLWPSPEALGPVTDLYQLTMMAGYAADGMAEQPATFELFVRRLPPSRAYLVFAGLEQAVGDLLRLAFSREQVDASAPCPPFARRRSRLLRPAAASCGSRAISGRCPRGPSCLRGRDRCSGSTAPLAQAQWVETFLLASLELPDAGGVEGRADRRGGGRATVRRLRRAARPWAARRVSRGPGGVSGRVRGHQPRRGRAGAWPSRRRHDGPFVGPVVRRRDGRVRRVRPRASRELDPAGGHVRHARRASPRRRDRAAGAGGPSGPGVC